MPSQARARARYLAGLPSFLRAHPSPESCRRTVGDQLARRSESLLAILERAVYANPGSPYRALLLHAGAELGDVSRMLAELGVEPTLSRLHEAGVGLSIDEFKGRVPIVRAGLELRPQPSDFDNGLLRRHYEAATSGARSASRIAIDLDLLAHEAAYGSLFLEAFGVRERPLRRLAPGAAGTGGDEGDAAPSPPRTGRRRLVQPVQPSARRLRPAIRGDDRPDRGGRARVRARGSRGHVTCPSSAPAWSPTGSRPDAAPARPAQLDTNWSSAVRVCSAAEREGLDLAGTFFRVGGEPATPARRAAIERAGCAYAAHYSMGEVGWIGIACPNRESDDEVHLAADKLAVIQPDAGSGRIVHDDAAPEQPEAPPQRRRRRPRRDDRARLRLPDGRGRAAHDAPLDRRATRS